MFANLIIRPYITTLQLMECEWHVPLPDSELRKGIMISINFHSLLLPGKWVWWKIYYLSYVKGSNPHKKNGGRAKIFKLPVFIIVYNHNSPGLFLIKLLLHRQISILFKPLLFLNLYYSNWAFIITNTDLVPIYGCCYYTMNLQYVCHFFNLCVS